MSRRIVVADDNTDSAEVLAALLRLEGHDVRCAADGTGAMQLYQTLEPDAMFLDISMPGMDGREVARRVRSVDPKHQVLLVAISGWAEPSDIERTLASGFDHYLLKPLDLESLARLIAAH